MILGTDDLPRHLHNAAVRLHARLTGEVAVLRAREVADVASSMAQKSAVGETSWKHRRAVELRAHAAAAIAEACAELI